MRIKNTLTIRRHLAATVLLAVLAGLPAACDSQEDQAALIVYEASAGGVTNIFTIDPESGETRQLTDAKQYDGSPAWSPDRKRIVFASKRDGTQRNDLYVMGAGSDVRRLTDTPGIGELSPRYSPDGRRIAYVADTGDGWEVRVMAADGSDQQRVAGTYFFAEFPAWTPDGGEIYFAAIEAAESASERGAANAYASSGGNTSHIYSVDLQTLEVRTRIRTEGIDVCPHITPDGERLLYASTRTADNNTHAVFVHDLTSGDTSGASDRRLTDGNARDDYPDPSPDGNTIVFTSDRDGNTEMYLMEADGSGQRRLTTTPELRENVPDW